MACATSPRRFAPALVLLGAVGAGCPAPWSARLVYPPAGDRAAAAVPPGAPAIALQPVADARAGQGYLVGSYERVAADEMPTVRMELVTQDDVPAWVQGALRRELQLAGLNVVDAGPSAGAPVLAATLSRLSCAASDPRHEYASRLELRVALHDGGRALLERTYEAGRARGFDVLRVVTDEGIEACLADALRDAARAVAADAARVLRAPAAAPADATPAATPTAPPRP